MSNQTTSISLPRLQCVPASAASAGVKDRLAQALDVANKLFVDAEYLMAETQDLFSTLSEITEDPSAASEIVNIATAALDDACWLARATENVQSAFDSLVTVLLEANEV